MALILIADKISDEGLRLLKTEHQVMIATGLSESELVAEMSGVVGLIVRSQTEVTRTIIAVSYTHLTLPTSDLV